MDDGVVEMVKGFSFQLRGLQAQMKGWKTIIVHPQVSKDFEEAAELDQDWKKKEEKQILENMEKIME